jgi:uncharacterized protein YndB with AHSA1/START domain
MSEKKRHGAETTDLVTTRVVDAPVEEVWRAWNQPEVVMQWWSPQGYTTSVAEIDFREGGTSLVCMRSPDGDEGCNTWHYRNIEPQKRIEFVARFADRECHEMDPAELGMPEMQKEMPTEVLFEALNDGRTKMTYTEHGYTSEMMLEFSKEGLEQALDKLEAALTG